MNASVSETARLAKLADYGVLDTPPEKEFDEITAAAARLFDLPISLVSLVDRDRQWFKARYGIGATETPRSQAFCAHAINGNDLFVVSDATSDARFSDNPLVTGAPNIRFYAGAPLITPDNFKLGTLCVIGTEPREPPTDAQTAVLTMLARLVVRELENRRIARRAAHQASTSAKLTEGIIATISAPTVAESMSVLAEHARLLCVADRARVVHKGVDGIITAQSQRDGSVGADLPWADLDAALVGKPTFIGVTNKALSTPLPSGGGWIGIPLRHDPPAALHVWRKLTTLFTEMEVAMLVDLGRVAASVLKRAR